MPQAKRITATEFKSTCLDLLDGLNPGEWDRVEVTKRGKVVAVVSAPQKEPVAASHQLHGFMKGSVTAGSACDVSGDVRELWKASLGC